ncbi:MAG: hypothetical protein K0U98_15955 [Deltaproteobacteria bacterium]|nr:hypothetical protein [Deltaproteobacteria bacterium]
MKLRFRFVPFLSVLLSLFLSLPSGAAENDGQQPPGSSRALETPVIAARLDGPFESRASAVNPRGGFTHGGYLYVAVHAVHGHLQNWKPRIAQSIDPSRPEITFCHDPNGGVRGEHLTLWRQRQNWTLLTQPWELVGRLSACRDVTDVHGGIPGKPSITITGTIARGEAASGGTKFYVTGQRTLCTDWKQSCMNAEFLGAAATPQALASKVADQSSARWRPFPLLALTDPADGPEFSFHGFLALQSYRDDPAAPWLFGSQRQKDSMDRPATLWGLVRWGSLTEQPLRLAAVQIADHSAGIQPNWQHTRAWVLTENRQTGATQWTEANAFSGQVAVTPKDISSLFPGIKVESLFYDTSQTAWFGIGHDNAHSVSPAEGCNEVGLAGGFSNGTAHSTVAKHQLGGSASQRFTYSTYTQNSHQIGALVTQVDGRLFLLRGSTEWVCLNRPSTWTHPWQKAEVTVELLP